MSLFNRNKTNSGRHAAPNPDQPQQYTTPSQRPSAYIDSSTEINLDGLPYQRDILGSIKEAFSLIPQARTIIPGFQPSSCAGYLDVNKAYQNKGKTDPYQEYVIIASQYDVFHFWYYPSGAIWKIECWFWPENDDKGYSYTAKRLNNLETDPLVITDLHIKTKNV